MEIKRIGNKRRMSDIVSYNGTIYLCGQVAEDSSKDIIEQTKSMLARVDDRLEQAGSNKEHILSATIYLKSMAHLPEMNEVWDNWIPAGCAPARACVEANMVRDDLLVEISVIAGIKIKPDNPS